MKIIENANSQDEHNAIERSNSKMKSGKCKDECPSQGSIDKKDFKN